MGKEEDDDDKDKRVEEDEENTKGRDFEELLEDLYG